MQLLFLAPFHGYLFWAFPYWDYQEDLLPLKLQILPNGTAWIPNLVKMIIDLVSNGSKAILVDKKLIEGPNPNKRGKFLIPLIVAFQVSF